MSVFSGSVYRRDRPEARRHTGCRRGEQCDEDMGRIEATLVGGTEDTGEDLLAVRAARRAVATTARLPRHDGGTERVFGAPIRRIERRVEKEAEDGIEFDDEVLLKAAHPQPATWGALEQAAQPLDVVAARHREAVRRHVAGAMRVPRRQRRLQEGLHRRDTGLSRIVEKQHATPPQQVCETRLMGGLFELPIRLPAVALQDARVVDADHGRRLRQSAAGLNRIDGRLGRDERPEPLEVGVHAPARFIRGDDRTAADRRPQRRIRRLRLARRAMDGVDQSAARDRQTEAVAQQRRDFAVGQPETFIEQHRQRDRLRPPLDRSGAERIRGLQRMTALHAAPAPDALTDVDVKGAHDRALHRQLFLILRGDAHRAHRAVAVWAPLRQARLVCLIDLRWRSPVGARAVCSAGFPSRPTWGGHARPARERRRLAIDGAARGVELFFQFFVFAPESLPLRFRSTQVFAEPFDLATLLVNDLLRVTR